MTRSPDLAAIAGAITSPTLSTAFAAGRKRISLRRFKKATFPPLWCILANASYRLGRSLRFDPETERVIGDEEANKLLRDGDRGYRAPFAVPEEV